MFCTLRLRFHQLVIIICQALYMMCTSLHLLYYPGQWLVVSQEYTDLWYFPVFLEHIPVAWLWHHQSFCKE